jgi:gamma-glutamyltranspeptidase/glutathione hydrolase
MAPAIKLARDGFPLTWEDAQDMRDPDLAKFSESRRIFQRNGNYYKAGDIFRQPELADSLQKIAANPDDFYHGTMARELAAAVQRGGSLITAEDLAKYEVKEREPVRGTYRGYEVISSPPPSSGGVALLEILNILQGYDLARYGDRSAEVFSASSTGTRRSIRSQQPFTNPNTPRTIPSWTPKATRLRLPRH